MDVHDLSSSISVFVHLLNLNIFIGNVPSYSNTTSLFENLFNLKTLLEITLVTFLVLLNGFFVAAEFSLVKVRLSRINQLIVEGIQRAKYVKIAITNLDVYLSACQLGITLSSLALGWTGKVYVEELIRPLLVYMNFSLYAVQIFSYAVAFGIITILQIVIGELAPKSLAIQKTETIALWLTPPLILFYKLTYPAIWFLNKLAILTLRVFGLNTNTIVDYAHTEEEIKILVNESQKSGYINHAERVLFDNVFEFSDRIARETMLPRTSMVVLYKEDSFEENLKIIEETRHTRYPIADGEKDNIIGFLHVSDIYSEYKKSSNPSMENIIREILSVPEFLELSKVMQLMKKHRIQIAVVVDEYGGTAGLLTLEDILEEIVGEIQDEFDTERPIFEEINDGFSIDGKMLIQDVNNLLGLDISNENVDTIGGWVHMMSDGNLSKGNFVLHGNVKFEISEFEKNHIVRVNARVLPLIEPK